MDKIRLGRTGLMVSRSGFGALPLQRISFDDAKRILLKAYDNGINFYDTARGYSDSEEKIGSALSEVRKDIIFATKSHASDKKTLLEHLDTSLKKLKTDYIDIYQLHNPAVIPDPEDPAGPYAGMLEALKAGKIRYIGITNHKLTIAEESVKSGLFDTVQFPFSHLSSSTDIDLVKLCKEKDVGFIAMKALSGGLITNVAACFVFLREFGNVVPIWGIQREEELDEFVNLEKNPPPFTEAMLAEIEKDKSELSGAFCRGCGYCMPCPVGIPISFAARIGLSLKRMPHQHFLEDNWIKNMGLITQCKDCGQCKDRCPYNLDTPALLKAQLIQYEKFLKEHGK